jgi:CheY-like chemotaxis protein
VNVGYQPPPAKFFTRACILLVDGNAERRALRRKILTMRGAEVVAASDVTEASSVWHRDRYDMVLIDIRRDHRGSLAWRDEIKKEKPQQIVAFLVGGPRYVDFEPLADSYAAEDYGAQWGDSLRQAVRKSCESLTQRNSFVEARWRIAAARRINGTPGTGSQVTPIEREPQPVSGTRQETDSPLPTSHDAKPMVN